MANRILDRFAGRTRIMQRKDLSSNFRRLGRRRHSSALLAAMCRCPVTPAPSEGMRSAGRCGRTAGGSWNDGMPRAAASEGTRSSKKATVHLDARLLATPPLRCGGRLLGRPLRSGKLPASSVPTASQTHATSSRLRSRSQGLLWTTRTVIRLPSRRRPGRPWVWFQHLS